MTFEAPKTVIEFSGWHLYRPTYPDAEESYVAWVVAHDVIPKPESSARVSVTITKSDVERNADRPEALQDLIRLKVGVALMSLADLITSSAPRKVPV